MKKKVKKSKFKEAVMLAVGNLKPVKKGVRRSKKEKEADRTRFAMRPGKRLSKNGKIYYESRENRAD